MSNFSRKLLPREKRYSTTEKECLAIKLATQASKLYFLGNRALKLLDKVQENNAKLSRWSPTLQLFQFVVQHRPGKDTHKRYCLVETVFNSLTVKTDNVVN